MRCKPGDIAIINYPGNDRGHNGKLVAVLHAAPGDQFRLPNGYLSVPGAIGDWVCESLGGLFDPKAYKANGATYRRKTKFAVINDKHLRPIRDPGDDAVDELVRPIDQSIPASTPETV